MKFSENDLDQIETLARLELTEDEKHRLRDQLSEILDHVETIGELDLNEVEPMTHPLELSNVQRADEVDQPLETNQVLKNAPGRTGAFFMVPRIIQDERE